MRDMIAQVALATLVLFFASSQSLAYQGTSGTRAHCWFDTAKTSCGNEKERPENKIQTLIALKAASKTINNTEKTCVQPGVSM